MQDQQEIPGLQASLDQSRPSFYPVAVIMAVVVILLLTPLITRYGGGALLLALTALLLWDGLSRQSYLAMQRSYPQLSRRWWIANALLHHLLLPALFFGTLALLAALFRAMHS